MSVRSNRRHYSSVGIVTRYGVDVPGFELCLGQDLLYPSTPDTRPKLLPVQWTPAFFFFFAGVKLPRPRGGLSTPSRADVVYVLCRVQLKCDGTSRRTESEVKGKLASGVGSQYSSHYLGTWCIQHYYR